MASPDARPTLQRRATIIERGGGNHGEDSPAAIEGGDAPSIPRRASRVGSMVRRSNSNSIARRRSMRSHFADSPPDALSLSGIKAVVSADTTPKAASYVEPYDPSVKLLPSEIAQIKTVLESTTSRGLPITRERQLEELLMTRFSQTFAPEVLRGLLDHSGFSEGRVLQLDALLCIMRRVKVLCSEEAKIDDTTAAFRALGDDQGQVDMQTFNKVCESFKLALPAVKNSPPPPPGASRGRSPPMEGSLINHNSMSGGGRPTAAPPQPMVMDFDDFKELLGENEHTEDDARAKWALGIKALIQKQRAASREAKNGTKVNASRRRGKAGEGSISRKNAVSEYSVSEQRRKLKERQEKARFRFRNDAPITSDMVRVTQESSMSPAMQLLTMTTSGSGGNNSRAVVDPSEEEMLLSLGDPKASFDRWIQMKAETGLLDQASKEEELLGEWLQLHNRLLSKAPKVEKLSETQMKARKDREKSMRSPTRDDPNAPPRSPTQSPIVKRRRILPELEPYRVVSMSSRCNGGGGSVRNSTNQEDGSTPLAIKNKEDDGQVIDSNYHARTPEPVADVFLRDNVLTIANHATGAVKTLKLPSLSNSYRNNNAASSSSSPKKKKRSAPALDQTKQAWAVNFADYVHKA